MVSLKEKSNGQEESKEEGSKEDHEENRQEGKEEEQEEVARALSPRPARSNVSAGRGFLRSES